MRRFVEPIERAEALDPLARGAAVLIRKLIKPGPVRDLLRGRWLGHPVHPAMTDMPIGFWTTSWVLDIAGGERTRGISDTMLALGVAASVPTVASGLTDWSRSTREQRRVGIVHGGTMLLTSGIYAWALASRKDRRKRVLLGQVGAATATAGATLGGYLVYAMGTGVRRKD